MTFDDRDLLTVLYTSRAGSEFDEGRLTDLLAQSRQANRLADITGMLLYRDGRFVQVLEGAPRHVTEVLERIRGDIRHSDVRVLLEEPIRARQFADWSMGFELMEAPSGVLPDGYRDTFADLDDVRDPTATTRAARELSMWFRVRAGRAASE